MKRHRDYLFVCGTPRSGTTAMARTLNCHPDIVIGIERFKHRYSKGELDDAGFRALFRQDRFFDFSTDDTNVSAETTFDRKVPLAKMKYESAIYVGDKCPHLYRRLRFLRRTFLACRVVFMLRDPVHVARSWQIRADNPCDRWRDANDYKAAVKEWNASIRHVTASIEMLRDDLMIVNYEDLFLRRSEATITAVLSRLHLDPAAPGTDDWRSSMMSFLSESRAIAASRRHVPDEVTDYVERNADFKAYEELTRLVDAHRPRA